MDMTATIGVNAGPRYRAPADRSARPGVRARLKDFADLTKPRMNALVLVTTIVGYHMAERGGGTWPRFPATLIGTALTAAGASVLNQVAERQFDALMPRTANRPLPAGRVRPIDAWFFGLALSVIGVSVLALCVNALTALLGAATLATYLLLYTPAKRHTTLCTMIGAIPGAMPAMMGFTAVDGAITAQALSMFAILFIWQIPHFFSIAVLYRADYARGGFRMLPVLDESLNVTTRQIMLFSAVLIPVTMLPVMLGMAGWIYGAAAVLLGVAFFAHGVVFAASRNRADARRLFVVSIVYLPALLAAITIDKL